MRVQKQAKQQAMEGGARSTTSHRVSIGSAILPCRLSEGRTTTRLLREQMGFGGVVVTGWADIDKLHTFHRDGAHRVVVLLLGLGRGRGCR